MQMIYLLVGVPGSGKSTVAESLKDRFEYVSNDAHIDGDYLGAILHTARNASQPVLCETPFSMGLMRQLEDNYVSAIPVFIIEEEPVLRKRWKERNTPDSAQKGHLTRQKTFQARAEALGGYSGTSSEVIEYLRLLPID